MLTDQEADAVKKALDGGRRGLEFSSVFVRFPNSASLFRHHGRS